MEWFSLLLPFGYLGVLVGSLATFSHLYRRRKALASTRLQPWFPPNVSRQIYLTLLEYASDPSSHQKIPDSVLRAALLRRATEDIHRLVQLRNSKPALLNLLQRGAVGDELWQRFQIAEKEMENELKEVVGEANALAQGQNWGQHIFQSAGEIAQGENVRAKLRDIEAERAGERQEWERRRENMREGFMKEIGDTSRVDGKPEKKPGSSDEDGVIVESGGPDAASAGTTGSTEAGSTGSGGGKKKKNKK
ncbi:MAG: translocation protein S66 [Alyxoria varia]|nr:MAG: translocation protein S66 [Alyxoria varia]